MNVSASVSMFVLLNVIQVIECYSWLCQSVTDGAAILLGNARTCVTQPHQLGRGLSGGLLIPPEIVKLSNDSYNYVLIWATLQQIGRMSIEGELRPPPS